MLKSPSCSARRRDGQRRSALNETSYWTSNSALGGGASSTHAWRLPHNTPAARLSATPPAAAAPGQAAAAAGVPSGSGPPSLSTGDAGNTVDISPQLGRRGVLSALTAAPLLLLPAAGGELAPAQAATRTPAQCRAQFAPYLVGGITGTQSQVPVPVQGRWLLHVMCRASRAAAPSGTGAGCRGWVGCVRPPTRLSVLATSCHVTYGSRDHPAAHTHTRPAHGRLCLTPPGCKPLRVHPPIPPGHFPPPRPAGPQVQPDYSGPGPLSGEPTGARTDWRSHDVCLCKYTVRVMRT